MQTMTPQLTLTDMPEVVMKNILQQLDFREIQPLRKVCHDLRNVIDEINPDQKATRIEIEVHQDNIQVFFDRFDGEKEVFVTYQKSESGCLVIHQEKEKNLHNEDFANIAANDLGLILRGQKSSLTQFEVTNEHAIATSFFKFFGSVLKSKPRPLPSVEFTANSVDASDIMLILPFLDPKHLESICLHCFHRSDVKLELNEIMKLEQWKKARWLKTDAFVDLETFFGSFEHFESAQFHVKTITCGHLIRLKETCLLFPNLLMVYILYETLADPLPFEIGAQHQNGEDQEWHFDIPSSEKVLRIVHHSIFDVIEFKKI